MLTEVTKRAFYQQRYLTNGLSVRPRLVTTVRKHLAPFKLLDFLDTI